VTDKQTKKTTKNRQTRPPSSAGSRPPPLPKFSGYVEVDAHYIFHPSTIWVRPLCTELAEKSLQNADFAMKQTNICRLSGDINYNAVAVTLNSTCRMWVKIADHAWVTCCSTSDKPNTPNVTPNINVLPACHPGAYSDMSIYTPKSAQVNFLWGKNVARTAIQQFYTPPKKKKIYTIIPQNKFLATPLLLSSVASQTCVRNVNYRQHSNSVNLCQRTWKKKKINLPVHDTTASMQYTCR